MPQNHAARQSFQCAPFREALERGIEEDGWEWDWTALGSCRPGSRARAEIIAKSAGIWAGDALTEALRSLAPELVVKSNFADGAPLKKGAVVMEWSGPARLILAYERPFLNLASYVSGIATETYRLVSAVRRIRRKNPPRVTATRKTLPAYRDIAIYGVRAGGGHSHRVSLSGGVLIKENHIAIAGGVSPAIDGARAVAPHGLITEVEVRSFAELDAAIAKEVGAVLLDNFTPAQVRSALKKIGAAPKRPIVEVSGGIHAANIAKYVVEGVSVISSGSLTHSVRALDLSLLIRK